MTEAAQKKIDDKLEARFKHIEDFLQTLEDGCAKINSRLGDHDEELQQTLGLLKSILKDKYDDEDEEDWEEPAPPKKMKTKHIIHRPDEVKARRKIDVTDLKRKNSNKRNEK